MRRSLRLLTALVVAAALLCMALPPASAAPGTWLSRINDFRAQNGLGPLTEDVGLNLIAQKWTQRMATNDVLAHNPSLNQELSIPWTRNAENVGVGGSEAQVFSLFLGSPGHRAKLLGAYNGIGIGEVFSGGRLWTTHVFVATPAPLRSPVGSTIAAAGRAAGGLWTATTGGQVMATAGAPHLGELAVAPGRPVVGMGGTPSGRGYWLVGGDGGVFAFGDAGFHGSAGALRLGRPVVGMASTPTGRGYWLVASDGGIFAFGDAEFHGSAGSFRLDRPIVGMSASPTGRGYWLVASDGGIFGFGDTSFYGSAISFSLESPVAGMTPSPTGRGYRMVAIDGGIFGFGDAPFLGSLHNTALSQPVVAMATTPSGRGYWVVRSDGTTTSFGDAQAT